MLGGLQIKADWIEKLSGRSYLYCVLPEKYMKYVFLEYIKYHYMLMIINYMV